MKLRGIRNIPKNHLPPILDEGIEQRTDIEIRYKLRATEYWATGSAVRTEIEAETPEQAYKSYWQLRKRYPGCKISLTQHLHLDYGGAVPISLNRLRDLASQK